MKKVLRYIGEWFTAMARTFANEVHQCVSDVGVMIFFFLLPLAYPIVYTLIYNPEVVTKMPMAVVDHDRTADSRKLVHMARACPAIEVYSYCNDLEEARGQMAEGDVYGILEIPDGYARHLGQGEQAVVQFYADASLLLRYRTFAAALSDLQLALASDITTQRVALAGAESMQVALPVESRSNFLGDTEQGFASFVIPGIVVLIIQQSLLLGIGMLAGTRRERIRRGKPLPVDRQYGPAAAIVWGRALASTVLYMPGTVYVLHVIPAMFNLPHNPDLLSEIIFIFPMLLAASFLGQSLCRWMKERESGFMLIVFTSPLMLFLSGLTWPRYGMNVLWKFASDLIPATWGIEGFVRINSNGALLSEVSHAYTMLWVLAGIYFVTALLVQRHLTRKENLITHSYN